MSKTILIVDDSQSVRKMVEFALKSRSYEVVAAEDGQQALEFLPERQFDLVVLDINMPRLDGLSFLEIIREKESYASLPILMLTTEGQDSDRDRALALGATNYMVKPFKPTELLENVANLLSVASE